MCGIAGVIRFNKKPVTVTDIKRMTDVIGYRGPDGEGHWINNMQTAGFGHRRLSIIDLSNNAKQPMHYADNRYSITFNGEIYNYLELKNQLVSCGYIFMSNSDTEVLLALYDHKKEECVKDLDGMFSFAIWDEKEQELFCARDRFGEKPFHYFFDGNEFVFCSEIKQLWSYGIYKKMNDNRLIDFLVNGNVEDNNDLTNTFYDGIKRLDAACYLKITSDNKLIIKKYWQIDLYAKVFPGTIEEASEEFLKLFRESIMLRMRSDVPVGSSLSGGLDSSSIVMIIDQMRKNEQRQNSFSARFKDYGKDEGFYIEEVKKACVNLNVNYTWPDENYFLKVFDKVNFHQDEPYGSASIVAQYAVMELAKEKNVTVLIDGQGADEYLGGYLPYYNLYLNQLFYNNRNLYKSELKDFNMLHGKFQSRNSLEDKETFRMKFGRYKRKVLNTPMPVTNYALKNELINETTRSGLKTLLRYADRNSMAHSREVRLPFLSHKLVEFVFSLPDNYKLNKGWTKFVLRKAMSNILPEVICWRVDKIGFEPPQSKWLKTDKIKSEINEASLKYKGILGNGDLNDNEMLNWRLIMANKFN